MYILDYMKYLEQQWLERDIYLKIMSDSLGRGDYWGTELTNAQDDNTEIERFCRERYQGL